MLNPKHRLIRWQYRHTFNGRKHLQPRIERLLVNLDHSNDSVMPHGMFFAVCRRIMIGMFTIAMMMRRIRMIMYLESLEDLMPVPNGEEKRHQC